MINDTPDLLDINTIISQQKIRANKNLGQNFIIDPDITDHIVLESDINKDDTILEIGGGIGSLTRSLIRSSAHKIFVIEKDSRFITILQNLEKASKGKLQIIHEDALIFDEALLSQGQKLTIVANLPYNIGTKLLLKWLGNLHLFKSITIMLQKDVVDRLIAKPSTSSYGSLGILAQWLCDITHIIDVPPEAFHPAPKITSSVVKLQPRATPLYPCTQEFLELVCRTAFNMRRKTIKKSLSSIFGSNTEKILCSVGISSKKRPEELSIEEFSKIAREASSALKE